MTSPLPPAAITRGNGAWTRNDTLLAALVAAVDLYFLAVSWRCWPDPQIDFGYQLYVPWRLAEGDLLYRDVYTFYGPLSQYLHALLFRAFGASLSVLVRANLVVYAGIAGLLFFLVRRGWGRLAAAAAGIVFGSVFSFSQLVLINNYNYATPYVEEATHGLLVLLALVAAWCAAVDRFDWYRCAAAGVLLGVANLLKVEVVLAGLLVSAIGLALLWRRHRSSWNLRRWSAVGLALVGSAAAPTLAAVAAFRGAGVPLRTAWEYANNVWVVPLRFPLGGELYQRWFLGTDDVPRRLGELVLYGAAAVAATVALAWIARLLTRLPAGWAWGLAAVAGGLVAWCSSRLPPQAFGRSLPGLLVAAALVEIIRRRRVHHDDPATAARLLFWAAACGMLARMALRARVEHYGFYQAPLAAAVGIGCLLVGVPRLLRVDGTALRLYRVLAAVALLVQCAGVARASHWLLAQHHLQLGSDADAFFALPPEVQPSGALVEMARRQLESNPTPGSVLVLPEGHMLNFLLRRRSPLHIPAVPPVVLTPRVRGEMLARLRATPPDRVVLLSRDLREFGVARFGDRVETGRELLDFVAAHYRPAFAAGGDPLASGEVGLRILVPRDTAVAGESPPRSRVVR